MIFDSDMLAIGHCDDTAASLPLSWARIGHRTLPWLGARGVRQIPTPHGRQSLWLFWAELSMCVSPASVSSVVPCTCTVAPRAQGAVTSGCMLGRSDSEGRGAPMAAGPHSQTRPFCSALGHLDHSRSHTGTEFSSLILLRCKDPG